MEKSEERLARQVTDLAWTNRGKSTGRVTKYDSSSEVGVKERFHRKVYGCEASSGGKTDRSSRKN